jgi:hypothetical protein
MEGDDMALTEQVVDRQQRARRLPRVISMKPRAVMAA